MTSGLGLSLRRMFNWMMSLGAMDLDKNQRTAPGALFMARNGCRGPGQHFRHDLRTSSLVTVLFPFADTKNSPTVMTRTVPAGQAATSDACS